MLQLESQQQSWHSVDNGQRLLSIPAIDHLTVVTHLSRALHAAAERMSCLFVLKHASAIRTAMNSSQCLSAIWVHAMLYHDQALKPCTTHVSIDIHFACALQLASERAYQGP